MKAKLIRIEKEKETVIFEGKPSQVVKYFVKLQSTMFVLDHRFYTTFLPKETKVQVLNGREHIFNS